MKRPDPLSTSMYHALHTVKATGRNEMLPDLVDAIKRVEGVRQNPFFSHYTGNRHDVLRLDTLRHCVYRNSGHSDPPHRASIAVA